MSTEIDDELWSAIGDPIRRQLIDALLAGGTTSVTGLSAQVPVTRQAVAKHLLVLDRAGLVHGTARGREKHYSVDSAQLAHAVAQLTDTGAAWNRRLNRIKQIAEAIQQKGQQ